MLLPDPTHDAMVTYLRNTYGSEPDDGDIAEAIYWFSYSYHAGQWSALYAAGCSCGFTPGLASNGVEPESMAEMLLQSLINNYAGKDVHQEACGSRWFITHNGLQDLDEGYFSTEEEAWKSLY